ncbi:diiron oxygenase [Bradyrhizobium prioriisuperbiae]|uniref:diiron oxygenase n=1 Tax=Bradyrhizobium prioriisuperbiae TaxID=2854389 RepID=UPI0028EA6A00|nr:diiron oxygenase [Bradyrhizobium prioritasuperba]
MAGFVENHGKSLPDAGALEALMGRLSSLSVQHYYNPYKDFEWPDKIADDCFWFSPELLSVYGTVHYDQLGTEGLMRLSKWESINMYSASVYGERDLILSVLKHMHEPFCAEAAEYFHHFVEEETKHMWLFAQFCNRYGQKIYQPKGLSIGTMPFAEKELVAIIAFAQILIFESVGDHFNKFMMTDERLPAVVRSLNRLHHLDESRHIAMGHSLLTQLTERAKQACGEESVQGVARYLQKFMSSMMQLFYNPEVYHDAGIAEPYKLRSALLLDPGRANFHAEALSRASQFVAKSGLSAH